MEIQRHLLLDLRQAMVNLNKADWKTAGFNMGMWARNKLPEVPELNCGTVCCAFGVGITLPSWKQAGLYLVVDFHFAMEASYHLPVEHDSADLLGLTSTQFLHIFGIGAYYPTFPENVPPSDVVDHIDNVLNGLI